MSAIEPSHTKTRRPLILAASCMAIFMTAVEQTIVGTSLPTIIADLGGFQLFSWVFAIYLLPQAVSFPIYGKLADVYGRKPVFFFGAAMFLAGSTLAGFSASMLWLIAFRAIQGLGAGAILSVPITVVGDIYAPTERPKIQGYLSGVWGVAAVIGPTLGAFLVEHVGWQYIFWVNLPVGAISITLFALFYHEEIKRHSHQIDYAGAALVTVGTGAFMLALIQYETLPGALVVGLLALAASALALFFYIERRAVEPMIPMNLLKHRVIAISNLSQIALWIVMISVLSFLPLYVQGVLGRTAIVAGFVLAVMSVSWSISSVVVSRVMLATSFRFTAILGASAMVVGSVLLTMLNPSRDVVFAGYGSLLIGVGMGFCNTTHLVMVQSSVELRQRGIVTSLNLFTRTVGQSVGAAIFGALLNYGVSGAASGDPDILNRVIEPVARRAMDPHQLAAIVQVMAGSLRNVFLIASLVAVVAVVLALRLPNGLKAQNSLSPKPSV